MPSSTCSAINHGICIGPLTGAVGAEISGVDLRDPIPENVFEVIEQALLNHLVIIFRDQDIAY